MTFKNYTKIVCGRAYFYEIMKKKIGIKNNKGAN